MSMKTKLQNAINYFRERADYSDKNQDLLNKIALSIFCDMKIITQSQYQTAIGGGAKLK